MDRKTVKQVVATVEKMFDEDFIASKTSEADVRQALDEFKARGAIVSETRKENTTWYSVICRYNGGENTWALTFVWNENGILKNKEKKMLHLGI